LDQIGGIVTEVKYSERSSFEDYGREIGHVHSVEDWARKRKLNVYVAVCEHRAIKEPIIAEIKLRGSHLILDVGCGYGFLEDRINAVCPQVTVTGTDISKHQVLNAKQRKIESPLVVCCAEYLPFKNSLLDFVVCSEVIEHVMNPRRSLSEMERVLRENGYLCISTDNPLSFYRRITKLIFGKTRFDKAVKEEFIPKSELAELIPESIKVYKMANICPYPLLPIAGPFGSEIVGKIWVVLAKRMEKIPYIGKHLCNKYIVFGTKVSGSVAGVGG
jgi:ubiquinone/menaquinone biosynthesis C-methylase UbiE